MGTRLDRDCPGCGVRLPVSEAQPDGRYKASVVGLNATTVQNALYDALGPKWSTTIYSDISQYRVLVELDPKYQGNLDSLEKVAFKAPNGSLRLSSTAGARRSRSGRTCPGRQMSHGYSTRWIPPSED